MVNYGYVAKADVILLVYDITDQNSISDLNHHYQIISQYAKPDAFRILIGNKVDLEDKRVVSKEEGQKLANDHNMTFFELSCKNKEDVLGIITTAYTAVADHRVKNGIVVLSGGGGNEKEKEGKKCVVM